MEDKKAFKLFMLGTGLGMAVSKENNEVVKRIRESMNAHLTDKEMRDLDDFVEANGKLISDQIMGEENA